MTFKQIEKQAQELFVKHGFEIPVEVVPIAKSLGLRIFMVDMPDFGKIVPSGVLSETEDYGWTILINNDDALTRKRFTIAHEIGHFVLHRGQSFVDSFTAGETFYRSDDNNTLEREANYFAACLLMPAEEVTKRWPSFTSPGAIAEYFNVSEVSMTFRLKNLGLID